MSFSRLGGFFRRSTFLEGALGILGALVLAAFALAGYSIAQAILPFWVGATVGYIVAHLATAAGVPRGAQVAMLALCAAALVVAGVTSAFSLMSAFNGVAAPSWLEAISPLREDIIARDGGADGRLVDGFLLSVVVELLRREFLPDMFADSVADAGAEGKVIVRGIGVFALVMVVLLTPIILLVALFAALVWAVEVFG